MHVSGPAEQTCKEELHYILNPSAQQLAFEQVALAAQLQPAGVVDQAPNKKGKKKKYQSSTAHQPQEASESAAAQPQCEDKRRKKRKKHSGDTAEALEQQQPEAAGTAT